MKKVVLCQSCGIPLDNKTPKGTELDGTLSEEYCLYCYQVGEWTSNLNFDEMYDLNLKRFKESDMSKMEKFFLTQMYTKKFMKKLTRWSD